MVLAPRKRRLSANAGRALEMLAADPRGVTEASMLTRGFTQRMLTGLVRSGLAMRYRMPMRAGDRTMELTYVMITVAGRRALLAG
jgi:hypothetical protein